YFSSRLQDSNERLRLMATRDMLTNVLNSHAYYEVSDSQIQVARRKGVPYSVLFIDLDYFKSVIDTHGHAAGDIVLKSVADCLVRSLRASDVLGRVGGEEFSVFLPNTDGGGAMALAEAIRRNIEILMPSTGEQILKITASIGVARNSPSEQTILDIQKQADQAMYRAKAAGRNRVSSLDEVAAL
ncbi:MAG: GGDEF domain-containing protein, partial [Betaproteobacteria bacterium]